MEVILKKTKITSTILNQTLQASKLEMKPDEVLGWCMHKTNRYIIFYHSATQRLRKYLMIKEVKIDKQYHTEGQTVKVKYIGIVKFEGRFNPHYHDDLGSEEKAENFKKDLEQVIHFAQMRGQIFI